MRYKILCYLPLPGNEVRLVSESLSSSSFPRTESSPFFFKARRGVWRSRRFAPLQVHRFVPPHRFRAMYRMFPPFLCLLDFFPAAGVRGLLQGVAHHAGPMFKVPLPPPYSPYSPLAGRTFFPLKRNKGRGLFFWKPKEIERVFPLAGTLVPLFILLSLLSIIPPR